MHIIRLRHPWQAAWPDHPTSDAPIPDRTAQQLRLAHYSRQFHRPSGLSELQPVTLVLQLINSASLDLQFAVHAILLNSQPLPLSVLPNAAEFITHISARIDSKLQAFNQIQIVCGIAAGEIDDNVIAASPAEAAPEPTAACSAPPPLLSQWAEVHLEIDD